MFKQIKQMRETVAAAPSSSSVLVSGATRYTALDVEMRNALEAQFILRRRKLTPGMRDGRTWLRLQVVGMGA